MILLLGANGYIGSEFARELDRRGLDFIPVGRVNHFPAAFRNGLVAFKPNLVINCAAYIPAESVSLCDQNQRETIKANTLLPSQLSLCCEHHGVPFAHISTGCLWNDGLEHSEDDPPQRAFNGHCGFYIGTKVLAEEAVRNNCEKHYIWRVRLPFDEVDHPRNYLSKLARFEEVWDHQNTICHRGDFVKACLDLWQMQAAWGTYHVANPGSVFALAIAEYLVDMGIRKNHVEVLRGKEGGSLLSVRKLLDAGVKIRQVEDALEDSIKNWKPSV